MPDHDPAAAKAVEKIFEADWTILNVPNAKDVFTRIIAAANAEQTKWPRCEECNCEMQDLGQHDIEGIEELSCPLCSLRDRLTAEREVRENLADICDFLVTGYEEYKKPLPVWVGTVAALATAAIAAAKKLEVGA